MPEVKLGDKHECHNCNAKFYDLGKKEIICPKCGTDQKHVEKAEKKAAPSAVAQAARQRRKAEVASSGNEEDGDLDNLPAETDEDEIDEEEFGEAFEDEDEEEEEDDDEID